MPPIAAPSCSLTRAGRLVTLPVGNGLGDVTCAAALHLRQCSLPHASGSPSGVLGVPSMACPEPVAGTGRRLAGGPLEESGAQQGKGSPPSPYPSRSGQGNL